MEEKELTIPATTPRNAPCPCGSGKKFKSCHMAAPALTEKEIAQRNKTYFPEKKKLEVPPLSEKELSDTMNKVADKMEAEGVNLHLERDKPMLREKVDKELKDAEAKMQADGVLPPPEPKPEEKLLEMKVSKRKKFHIVLCDSKFGQQVGFTSQNFRGQFVQPMKRTKHDGSKQKEILYSAKHLMSPQDSYLWMDETRMRVLIINANPIDHQSFGMDDLMVNIAQLGYDVAMVREEFSNYKGDDNYTWTTTKEIFQGRTAKVYTMSCVDILTKIHPLVIKKMRTSQRRAIELLQKPDLKKLEKVELINHAIFVTQTPAPFITLADAVSFPDTEITRRYRFAEDILFTYYLRENLQIYPPVPFEGQKLLKGKAVMQYSAERKKWELLRVVENLPEQDLQNEIEASIPQLIQQQNDKEEDNSDDRAQAVPPASDLERP